MRYCRVEHTILLATTFVGVVRDRLLAMHSLIFSTVHRISSDGKKVRVLVKTGETLGN